ncbi:autotransporter domain-containing protein [Martelella alba]|uniref:Autotransporter domain-containing protein n=1 Tax=Martelella alba TaxID=2590451 RepID=A0A506TZ34_9HYPH|nr:autotransporter domain-containing protein [Martelella alba]TPW26750.1 autotransporter domain-containing protein [Martelella alba]
MTRTISKQAASTTNAGKTKTHRGTLMKKRRALLLAQSACAGVVAGFVCFGADDAAAFIETCPSNPINTTGVTVVSKTCVFAGTLYVGKTQDGELTISGGGKVESESGSVGAGANGQVTVTGSGSSWILTGDMMSSAGRLYVGQSGDGTLTISDGGYVSNLQAYVIGDSSTVTVTGKDSHWDNGAAVQLGGLGTSILRIEDQGKVSGVDMLVGGGSSVISVESGTIIVSDANSLLDLSGSLTIGSNASSTMTISQGGTVNSGTGIIAKETLSNSAVTVTGAGSKWAIQSTLVVGLSGQGALSILDGGLVEVGSSLSISGKALAGATDAPGQVLVSGTGSQLTVGSKLTIGTIVSQGPSSSLQVADGGTVDISGTLTVGSSSSGEMVIDNGTVKAENVIVGEMSFGEVYLVNGGVLEADEISLSRPVEGTVTGGWLNIGVEWPVDNMKTATAPGTLNASKVIFEDDSAALNFMHTSEDYVFSADLVDDGNNTSAKITQAAGTTTLTGDGSTFAGIIQITGGALYVDNKLGTDQTTITVSDSYYYGSGTLGGSGSVGGNVQVGYKSEAILSPGSLSTTGTLSIGGNLALKEGATTVFRLNTPDVSGATTNDYIVVGGDLELDGVLETTAAAPGYYYLISYDGTLSGAFDSVTVSGLVDGTGIVDTDRAGEVNITITGTISGGGGESQTVQFWDGSAVNANMYVDGGSGTWNLTNTNWTLSDGWTNDVWGGYVGVFMGDAGTVTVEGTQEFDTLQFKTDGYVVNGGALALSPASGDGGIFNIDGGVSATVSSMIVDGTKSMLIKAGDGTLILTGDNSYTGGTRVIAGRLVGNVGSIRGDIAMQGVVEFAQDTDGTFAGDIDGYNGVAGQMVKSGAGALTLTGTSTVDWSVEEGNLISTTELFFGDLDVAESASMTFDQAFDGTYSGTISGSGDIIFTGGGLVTLTGDSTDYTGASTVSNFTLHLDGNIGGTISLSGSGKLTGNGTVGSISVDNGGTVSPGNSIGTINVAGDVSFGAGSIYEVETEPSDTTADLIVATGTATLTGGDVLHIGFTGSYAAESEYTILTADGGVTGTFDGVTTTLAYLDPFLEYTSNSVLLRLERNAVAFAEYAETPNQRATANGAESLEAGNSVYDALLGLEAADAPAAFDALSGEIHASVKTGMIEDSRFIRDAALGRVRAATGSACGEPAGSVPLTAAQTAEREANGCADGLSTPAYGAWMQAFGGAGHVDGDGNAAKLDTNTGGFIIGGDAGFGDAGVVGFMAGYQSSSYDVDERASSADATSYQIGIYGGTSFEGFNISGGAAYAWSDIDTARTAAFTGFSDTLTGSTNGGTAQVFGEIGYEFDLGTATIEPFAGLAYVSVHTDAYSETGGAAALAIASDTTDMTYSTLGLRGAVAFDKTARLTGMLGWRHAYGTLSPTAVNAFAGGTPFTVAGVPVGEDVALVSAGVEFDLGALSTSGLKSASLTLSYDGQFGSGVADSAAMARFSFKF